jgi:hypothetical protein
MTLNSLIDTNLFKHKKFYKKIITEIISQIISNSFIIGEKILEKNHENMALHWKNNNNNFEKIRTYNLFIPLFEYMFLKVITDKYLCSEKTYSISAREKNNREKNYNKIKQYLNNKKYFKFLT